MEVSKLGTKGASMKGLKVSQTREAGISPCLCHLYLVLKTLQKNIFSQCFFLQMIICFYVFLTWTVISGQSCLTKQISFAMCSPFSAVKNYKGNQGFEEPLDFAKMCKKHSKWLEKRGRKPADTLLNYFYSF